MVFHQFSVNINNMKDLSEFIGMHIQIQNI